jgi:pimeloyl-ACP methyl ester carboxylesterase
MPYIPLGDNLDIHCYVDNFARPWETRTPVLMMHAYARNALFWDPWVPLIANRRSVYRPEIPGCGRSAVPPLDYVFEADRLLDSVIAVLDHFSLERVHWIGDASGGMLGVLMALRHPGRLRSLVMCNSSAKIPEAKVSGAYTLGEDNTLAAIRKFGVPRWIADTMSGRVDTTVASPALVRWMTDQMSQTPTHVAIGLFACFSSLNLRDELPKVKTPTLLLSGAESPVAAHHRELEAVMPNARATRIAGCGHGVNYVFPEICVEETLRFWDEVGNQADG